MVIGNINESLMSILNNINESLMSILNNSIIKRTCKKFTQFFIDKLDSITNHRSHIVGKIIFPFRFDKFGNITSPLRMYNIFKFISSLFTSRLEGCRSKFLVYFQQLERIVISMNYTKIQGVPLNIVIACSTFLYPKIF